MILGGLPKFGEIINVSYTSLTFVLADSSVSGTKENNINIL